MTDRSRIPADFNPWMALDALKGITEALHWHVTEGPSADTLDRDTHASLVGLSFAARKLARELNAWFREASEAGLELPVPRKDIQDDRGTYTIN